MKSTPGCLKPTKNEQVFRKNLPKKFAIEVSQLTAIAKNTFKTVNRERVWPIRVWIRDIYGGRPLDYDCPSPSGYH